MNKNLVCYFSASGVTKEVAERLVSITGGDLFEIEPMDKYTDDDLNWYDKNSRSSLEMASDDSRPEIKDMLDSIDEYNTILIGYPIWWNLAPRIINTFIESVNLDNKRVYLFATSGGSGIRGSLDDLRKKYPNINIIDGRLLSRNMDENEILSWLER